MSKMDNVLGFPRATPEARAAALNLASDAKAEEFAALAGLYAGLHNLSELNLDREVRFRKMLRYTLQVYAENYGIDEVEKRTNILISLMRAGGPDAA